MDSFEIPCILGAAYGVKKEWYEYCDGWWGHKSWGTLEPYISLKSWLFGGSCRTAPEIEAGHIFKRHGTHGTSHSHLTYNKLLVATLLFDDHDTQRLIDFLGNNTQVSQAMRIFEKVKASVLTKKEEYRKKITFSIKEYCDRFSVDFRDK